MTTQRSRLILAFSAFVALAASAAGQSGNNTGSPLDPQPNGVRRSDPGLHVLADATVHLGPGRVLSPGTVVIRDGLIEAVGGALDEMAVPAGAQLHRLAGMHVYAGFIDAHLPIAAPRPDINAPGAHWNAGVTPQRSALDAGGVPPGDAERLRGLGFTAAAIAPEGGIFAGRAALVSLGAAPADPADGRPPVYREDVYQTLAFTNRGAPESRGEFSGYPNSQMGVIALMRQTLSDADWREARGEEDGSCLAYLERDLGMPLVFRTNDELEGLRAGKIGDEFGRPYIIIGTGTEFRRLEAVAGNAPEGRTPAYILPLTAPETPEIGTVGEADSTDLRTLMTWEQAPTNARRLDEAGVRVALTASGLRRGEKFGKNLREAIRTGGLAPERALAMLTTNPAAMLGADDRMGTVESGKLANLVVATGDLFDTSGKGAEIVDVWIDGARHAINAPPPPFDGEWTLRVGEFFSMTLVIDGQKVTGIEGEGDDAAEGEARMVKMDPNTGTISFVLDDADDGTGTYVQTGVLGPDGVIRGTGLAPDNSVFEWTAARSRPEAGPGPGEDDEDGDEGGESDDLPPAELPGYPFGPYALRELPAQRTVIFHNGTIWTSGPEGVIENGWVAIEGGKIIGVGRGGVIDIVTRHEPVMVDLHGKHLTAGLIDCHSHTGISRGVNESGQAVTAEVRIGDVTDPDDINWYRQLAGGMTLVNNLHGSANPIGGQSQTNKIRWGVVRPDEMHMEGAKPGIKFALGENVKQSNWDSGGTRYPQTRMGVETLIRDRFTAAAEYAAKQQAMSAAGAHLADALESAIAAADVQHELGSVTLKVTARSAEFRRDLELEALAEILAGDRLVHCHSYRQDEILMLCRVAEDFGFKIGTFQHGLEVYKVAEFVREDAIGASLFADWWAYKVEVQDAIAQAGPLQTEVGVLTSYNSDSDELARRMNVEAAKAYKYSGGRLSKEDALKFVTINPAIQLGIGDRVGSIEVGKDADLAVWSGEPLSSFSMCEATWIDGREYFSLERDAALREQNSAARSRITQKILTEGAPKAKSQPEPEGDTGEDNTTDEGPTRGSLRERMAAVARTRHYLDLYLRGINPADHRCGECGVTQLQLGGQR